MEPLKESQVKLWLVLVRVQYSKPGFDTGYRTWIVRIVAPSVSNAQTGAMNWAQQQKADGILEDAKPFAYEASIVGEIGAVDCIGESVWNFI
jgi:hypothetical protein